VSVPAVSRRLNGLYVILSSALASLCFTVLADGFWSALTPRFAAESGFAGVHILGMNQVADRLNGKAQARARTLYTGPFAIGSDLSYLAAGFLVGWSGWEAIFIAASIGSLLLIPIVTLIGPAAQGFRSAFSPAVLFWRRCASLAGVRQFNHHLVLVCSRKPAGPLGCHDDIAVCTPRTCHRCSSCGRHSQCSCYEVGTISTQ